ncbi:MAG: NAD-dependent epimerase/dehydratase family protein [Planctomycetaceae bacterium]|jgi:predicted dehydrogenase/nucleoside-diphosphate-sugar epimerase|nr:NAD-dependent epimerase/dehydratase family protein [Planctomycetaceae bacterium]
MGKKSKKPFTVALVGAGQIAEFHLRGIKRFTNAAVVGIADLNFDGAKALAKRHKIAENSVYGTLSELLEKKKPDIVHICTPPSAHLSNALESLAAGCHIYVEKPLSVAYADCDKIEEAAKKAGKLVCAGHSMLRDPFIEKALRMVKAGKIGKVLAVDHFRSQEFPPYEGGQLPERCRTGGFPFWDVGVHSLYLMVELLGEIRSEKTLTGQPGENNNPRIKDWYSMLQCERGVAHVYLTWNQKPLQNILHIHGTHGTIRADIFGMNVTCRPKRNRMPGIAERLFNAMNEGRSTMCQIFGSACKIAANNLLQNHGIQVLIGDFYNAVENREPPPVSIADAKNVIQWTETIAQQGDKANDEFLKRFPHHQGNAATLVTGATGFIGHHLLERLLKERDRVRILVRKEPAKEIMENPKVEVFLGDIGDRNSVFEAMKGIKEVFHLGAIISGWREEFLCGTIHGTENMIDAAVENGAEQFVYMSSLSVLQTAAAKSGVPIREDWQYEPFPNRRGGYTESKLEAEKRVLDAVKNRNLPAVLLRPGEVVGPDRPFLSGAAAINAGGRFVVFGSGKADIPVIWVSDLIDAAMSAAEKQREKAIPNGSIYNLVEPVKMKQDDVVRTYCETTGKKVRFLHVPMWFVQCGAWFLEKALGLLGKNSPLTPYRLDSAIGPRDFDCSKAEKELDWKPQVGVFAGLKAMRK